MATRSQLDFVEHDEGHDRPEVVVGRIYHHWDGYPEWRLLDIFRALVRSNIDYVSNRGFQYRQGNTPEIDACGGYITDLAGYYILANKEGPGNVEIDNTIHGDIEYLYDLRVHDGRLYVKILEPKEFFKSNTKKEFKVKDEGYLKDLLQKYCREEDTDSIIGEYVVEKEVEA